MEAPPVDLKENHWARLGIRCLGVVLLSCVGSVVLCCGGGSLAFWAASHDEILRATSPDRQVDAVVHEVNTGAMDDYTGWIFLVPHGGRVWPWSAPEIVVAGSPGRGGWKDRRFSVVGLAASV